MVRGKKQRRRVLRQGAEAHEAAPEKCLSWHLLLAPLGGIGDTAWGSSPYSRPMERVACCHSPSVLCSNVEGEEDAEGGDGAAFSAGAAATRLPS